MQHLSFNIGINSVNILGLKIRQVNSVNGPLGLTDYRVR